MRDMNKYILKMQFKEAFHWFYMSESKHLHEETHSANKNCRMMSFVNCLIDVTQYAQLCLNGDRALLPPKP